jgi:hypothetical protein
LAFGEEVTGVIFDSEAQLEDGRSVVYGELVHVDKQDEVALTRGLVGDRPAGILDEVLAEGLR